tara:strand:+ start:499 stop:891 length:393 start_codon:yes stop_codon:yes gene_type:complete
MLAVACVVINETNDKVLLRVRSGEVDSGKWEIFGSFVKEDELVRDAVLRVVLEKATVLGKEFVKSISFTGDYYDEIDRHPGKRCVPLLFEVVVSESSVESSDSLKWFEKDDALDLPLALDNEQMLIDVFE